MLNLVEDRLGLCERTDLAALGPNRNRRRGLVPMRVVIYERTPPTILAAEKVQLRRMHVYSGSASKALHALS